MHHEMQRLSQLPIAERLELVQDLWDSIDESREQMPILEWHRELVKARLAEFEGREEDIGLSRENVWSLVDDHRGA